MEIAIIGAGHNGLVCANYLARAGHQVTIFEKNESIGGLCQTEEIFPGYKVSTAAHFYGLLSEQIVTDLGLQEIDDAVLLPKVSKVTLLMDGKYIVHGQGENGEDHFSFELNEKEKNGWSKFWNEINRSGQAIKQYFTRIGVTQYEFQKALEQEGFIHLGSRLFEGVLLDIIDNYFEDPGLRAAACATSYELPTRKGTVFGCVYRASASVKGQENTYAQLKGGMGVITQALMKKAIEAGVKIETSAPVSGLQIEKRKVTGLKLENGEEREFGAVVSSLDPRATFGNFLDEKIIPMSIRTHLKTPIPPVSSALVHFSLKDLPSFPVLDSIENGYEATVLVAPYIENIIQAQDDTVNGKLPENPVLTVYFPSVLDPDCAPSGKHLMSVEMHHVPVTNESNTWSDENCQVIVDKVLETLEKHSPDIRASVEASSVVSPGHLESRFGIVTRQCGHLPMTAEYLAERRRMPGCGQHTSAITRLYQCGAATFPGSGVSGAPGYNCARVITSILKEKKK